MKRGTFLSCSCSTYDSGPFTYLIIQYYNLSLYTIFACDLQSLYSVVSESLNWNLVLEPLLEPPAQASNFLWALLLQPFLFGRSCWNLDICGIMWNLWRLMGRFRRAFFSHSKIGRGPNLYAVGKIYGFTRIICGRKWCQTKGWGRNAFQDLEPIGKIKHAWKQARGKRWVFTWIRTVGTVGSPLTHLQTNQWKVKYACRLGVWEDDPPNCYLHIQAFLKMCKAQDDSESALQALKTHC